MCCVVGSQGKWVLKDIINPVMLCFSILVLVFYFYFLFFVITNSWLSCFFSTKLYNSLCVTSIIKGILATLF